MRIIGIDCGKDGAICSLQDGVVQFFDVPTMAAGTGNKRDYDLSGIGELLTSLTAECPGNECHVFIEKQQAMPKQGVVSCFQIGMGYGIWLGCMAILTVPFTLVHPTTWKKRMLSDMPVSKEASVHRALQLFPHVRDELKRKKDHNRAEALLIAEYGRRSLAVPAAPY